MSTFEALTIVGIDPDRPPRMRKEAYIDLFFRLSAKAPQDWCEDFNALGRQLKPEAKIDKTSGECIESYVNDMENIQPQLNAIKQILKDCNTQYLEKIQQRIAAQAASNAALQGQDGLQHQLNQIVNSLDFSV